MLLNCKTDVELLDLARGERYPTPMEAELTRRLAGYVEAKEMVEERPSRTPQLRADRFSRLL